MTLAITLLLASLAPAAFVAADIIEVPGDYPTIQEAIDAAVDGDEVHVAGGTYYEAIDFLGKSIRVLGADAPPTIIDGSQADRSVVTFQTGESRSAILERCWIEDGIGTAVTTNQGEERWGGGILIRNGAGPTIRDCVLEDNTAERGGGLLMTGGSTALFDDVNFYDNTVFARHNTSFAGGAARVEDGSAAEFMECSFRWNTARTGGAIGINSASITATRSGFYDNVATAGEGGAVRNLHGEVVEFDECYFERNLALVDFYGYSGGGAISNSGLNGVSIRSCEFRENLATQGGAIMLQSSASSLIEDSRFEANAAIGELGEGGAIHGDARIITCEFIENWAERGGAVLGGELIERSVFRGNWALYRGGAICWGYEISECIFEDNWVASPGGIGGAVAGSSYTGISRSTFARNHASIGGAVAGAYASANSVFYDNFANLGGAVAEADMNGGVIIHCTFVRNSAGEGAAVAAGDHGIVILSSILVSNDGIVLWPPDASWTIQQSIIEGGVPWTSNPFTSIIDADPRLTDPDSNDFSLLPDSPAIDVGNHVNRYEYDYAGAPRRVGSFPDIGAYENQEQEVRFEIRPPSRPTVGSYVTIPFGGASPGDRVLIAYSLRTGREKISICPGVFIDLVSPVQIGIGVADKLGSGTSPEKTVPDRARGRIMYFQAINLDTCEVSNLVSHYWR